MCEHSIAMRGERGCKAMHINFVVSANQTRRAAVAFDGIETVGTVDVAFRLPSGEYVDHW